MKKITLLGILGLLAFCLLAPSVYADHGATLSLTPSTGTFVVGSTFDVSLMLDTNGVDMNAVAAFLKFPSDKLQVISSSAGKSVVTLWSVPPRFNNQNGTIELQGVVTGGLNATNALITTITFRVRGTGSAIISIADESRVLKHDGSGTDFLQHHYHGIYTLVLPPPAGPLVVSETHPNQEQWYKNFNVSITWSQPSGIKADGYSYVLNAIPVDTPDTVSEGQEQFVVYQQVGDGIKYFHIKAFRNGVWGGTTHFALQIDTTEPAEFPLEISPSARTSEKQPVVRFITTDALSGISRYELKVIPLSAPKEFQSSDQPLFIEAQSPFILSELTRGRYDVLVRAYDNAGNFRESVRRITIRDVFFGFASNEGFEVDGWFVIPWSWIFIVFMLLFVFLGYRLLILRGQDNKLRAEGGKDMPASVRNELKELKKYREKYGKMLLVALMIGSLWRGHTGEARELMVDPPLITTVSGNISNQDIFYVGGKTNISQSKVVFYLQNLATGETRSFETLSNEYGDWFYSHDTFLSSGDYVLWAQSSIGEILSAPSSRVELMVRPTAVQFRSSRLAYDSIYQIALVLLSVALVILTTRVVRGHRKLRARKEQIMKEVREAEEVVRQGFALLRRDIQHELETIQKMKLEKELREEEKEREKQLLGDLTDIERRIGEEIWDIEKFGY